MRYIFLLVLVLLTLNGCILTVLAPSFITDFFPPYRGNYVDYQNSYIGKQGSFARLKYADAGKIIIGNIIKGDGFTHITTNSNGDYVYHRFELGLLQHKDKKIIKCLIYYTVDPKTDIIQGWGFDKGGDSESCYLIIVYDRYFL